MVRLFVAIDLPDNLREQFGEVQKVLSAGRAKLTMVDPESMHITLKFIGEVNGSSLSSICNALKLINYPFFTIDVGLIGVNSSRSPRIIWAGLSDQGKASGLVRLIDTALKPLGIEPEKRKYHPHITIARIRQFNDSLFDCLAGVCGSCSGIIPATRFVLKKSELTPTGPIYTDILAVPLSESQ